VLIFPTPDRHDSKMPEIGFATTAPGTWSGRIFVLRDTTNSNNDAATAILQLHHSHL
jgi:hypothetical protein